MANGFIAMVYASLKENGINTTGMLPNEAIEKFKELNKTDSLKKEEILANIKFVEFEQNDITIDEFGFTDYDDIRFERILKDRNDFFKGSFEKLGNSTRLKELFKDFTDYKSKTVNGYLRGYRKLGEKEELETKILIGKIESTIANFEMPKGIKVYRNFDIERLKHYNITDKNVKSLVGKIITEKGFSSTSLDRDIAQHFENKAKSNTKSPQIMFEINVPKGKNKAMPIWDFSTYEIEQEILLQRDAKFKISDVQINKSGKITVKGDML